MEKFTQCCPGLWRLFLLDWSWSYVILLDSIELLTTEVTCSPIRCHVVFDEFINLETSQCNCCGNVLPSSCAATATRKLWAGQEESWQGDAWDKHGEQGTLISGVCQSAKSFVRLHHIISAFPSPPGPGWSALKLSAVNERKTLHAYEQSRVRCVCWAQGGTSSQHLFIQHILWAYFQKSPAPKQEAGSLGLC